MSAIDLALPQRKERTLPSASLWATLAALSFGAFIVGTSEFLLMGILPDVASNLDTSVGLAGQLVTAFALGIAIGAPILAAFTARLDRRNVAIGAMALFLLTNLVVATTSDFTLLMITRFAGGALGGLFYGVAFGAAARLAPPLIQGRAIATVLLGVTLATVLGLPVGIWLGHLLGWQLPFALIAVLAAIAMAFVRLTMPALPGGEAGGLAQLLSVLRIPAVMLTFLGIILLNAGWFAAYTYITPFLSDVTGLTAAAISVILIGYGIMSAIGNVLGGRYADRSLKATIFGSVVLMAVALMGLRLGGELVWVVLPLTALWAISAWSFVAAAQTRSVQAAGPAGDLAVSLSVSAFNVGNALGAATGGWIVETTGIVEAMTTGSALALLALVPLLLSFRSARGRSATV
jgi:MFS transporter, DHA1 family, inner membrane transport protein